MTSTSPYARRVLVFVEAMAKVNAAFGIGSTTIEFLTELVTSIDMSTNAQYKGLAAFASYHEESHSIA